MNGIVVLVVLDESLWIVIDEKTISIFFVRFFHSSTFFITFIMIPYSIPFHSIPFHYH